MSVQALSSKVCEFDCYCPVKVFICNFTEYNSRRMRLTFTFTSVLVKTKQNVRRFFCTNHSRSRFRTASQTEGDIQCIQSRLVHPENTDYPVSTVLYFWDSFFGISCLFFISLNCFFSNDIFFSAGFIAL